MLRSLGSSLLAKSTPGSASRDLTEQQIGKPALPGKGEIGTISRDLVSEPNAVPVAPGTEKVLAAGPGVEGSNVVSPTEAVTPPSLLADGGGFGLPNTGNVARGMPFTDSFAPASAASAPAAGKTAVSRSGGGQSGPVEASGSILPTGASTSVVAPRSQDKAAQNPTLTGLLGTRVSADEGVVGPQPQIDYPQESRGLLTSTGINRDTGQVSNPVKTTGQAVAGAVGKILSSIPATKNVGNQLQSFGGSATAAAQGSGSVSNALRSIVNSVSSSVKSSPIVSILRSLLGKK